MSSSHLSSLALVFRPASAIITKIETEKDPVIQRNEYGKVFLKIIKISVVITSLGALISSFVSMYYPGLIGPWLFLATICTHIYFEAKAFEILPKIIESDTNAIAKALREKAQLLNL